MEPATTTRPQKMEDVLEALRKALRQVARHNWSRGQVADLANEICEEASVDSHKIRHWLDDQKHLFVNPLAIIAALARLGELEPLEIVAEAAGYQLRPIVEADVQDDDVAKAASAALGTDSALVVAFLEAFKDGEITPTELDEIVDLHRRGRAFHEGLLALAEACHDRGLLKRRLGTHPLSPAGARGRKSSNQVQRKGGDPDEVGTPSPIKSP